MDARLATLRAALAADDSLVVHAPASEAIVAAFEAAHRIALPADYRRFVREVCDGIDVDGEPGLYPLAVVARELAAQKIDPTRPFPYASAEAAEAAQIPGTPAGCLPVAFGDGNDFPILIVTGALAGSMWRTGEVDAAHSPDFVTWFEFWGPNMLGLRLD